MNKTIKISIFLMLFFFSSSVFSQIYSPKDIVNVYDPFTLTFGELVLNTNDEDFKEHNFVIIITITIGPEKIIKFLYKDDLLINNVKNYNDEYWAINFTARKNNIVLIPAIYNIANNGGMINIRMEGYSNISAGDESMMSQLSTGYVYTSSTMYASMEQAYKYLASSPEVNKPNSSLLTTAEVLQRNVSTRPGIFYLGNPTDISYAIPEDPKKVIGTNLLIQGQKKVESKLSNKAADVWNILVTKYTDVKLVQGESYFNKIKGAFSDIINMPKIDENKREGLIARCNEIINEDLVMGRKAGVYMNNEVIEQFTYLMNFVKAGIRAKSDTAATTADFMKADEREALNYFETNLKENDFDLNNQYLFDDYINSSVNRGAIQKEIDIIRRYYQLK
ncbi:MAG TPA: hypothetical protein PK605_04510 [Ignavibacteria bacterium]|nr:hypothetical protein [Ignavibacteria bacterium]HAX49774.1 hypothetical protein [Bacteroidota bacterium]HRF66459.1 hypothetical protein [Ignavibacteria bacterium]HRJ03651.1 hypothetical protein [Ignavibacteria bacterium]HRJ84274.1 hypothetical protein [Ignavibacteria bacterium]